MAINTSKVRSNRDLQTSLFKALDVLTTIAQASTGITTTELLRTSPMPRSSLLRILRSLQVYGLIQRDSKEFRPTRQFYTWTTGEPTNNLRDHMRPRLERLCREVKELVVLGVAEGNRLRHIDYVEWEHQLVVRPGLAQRHPLHRSAMGKLLLSQRPDLRARIANPALIKEIEQAGRDGHAWNREETAAGIIAVAAWAEPASPISSMISVSWPVFRFSEQKARQALKAIEASIRKTPKPVQGD